MFNCNHVRFANRLIQLAVVKLFIFTKKFNGDVRRRAHQDLSQQGDATIILLGDDGCWPQQQVANTKILQRVGIARIRWRSTLLINVLSWSIMKQFASDIGDPTLSDNQWQVIKDVTIFLRASRLIMQNLIEIIVRRLTCWRYSLFILWSIAKRMKCNCWRSILKLR